jgi:hypothetical protein
MATHEQVPQWSRTSMYIVTLKLHKGGEGAGERGEGAKIALVDTLLWYIGLCLFLFILTS